ncbi:MAG: hypothetical protein ACI9FN_000065 [Saprospiraceae bacterium]|jgi:hypothetical protein
MSFTHSSGFKYLKNLIIGVGAALVMMGALWKIQSWEMPIIAGMKFDLLTIGLVTEAFLFFGLGVIGPEKDYYWEKLYPGVDKYNAKLTPLSAGSIAATETDSRALNAEAVEGKLGGMLDELQSMSKSLGSLKALQEIDFGETSNQLKSAHNFYTKLNEAMSTLSDTVEDTKEYKEQMSSLNKNLSSLNGVYGNMLSAMTVKQ